MRVKFFPFKNLFIAFECDSLRVYLVDAEEKKRLARLTDNDEAEAQTDHEKLSTLVLHVSNTCNMACAYCFANHGRYRSKDALMRVDTAITAVDLYLDHYGKLGEIKFFGGEPLCAWPVIEKTVLHVEKRCGSAVPNEMPNFRVITNGTLLNERMMEFIAQHGIKVVFSIDGPQTLHDRLRCDNNGQGTLARIEKNYWRLREYTDGKQPQGIDVTYTAEHIRMGYGIARLVAELSKKYDVSPRKVNVSFVSALPDSLYFIKDERQCVHKSLEQYRASPDMADQKTGVLLKRLRSAKKAATGVCGAGSTWAAVSATGDVYPCLMFVDEPTLKMGSVYDKNLFQSDAWCSIHQRLSELRQKSAAGCDECAYNRLCSSCMGINAFHSGNMEVVSDDDCQIMREKIEWCIHCIAQEQWRQLIDKE